jgi:hypothetical protein
MQLSHINTSFYHNTGKKVQSKHIFVKAAVLSCALLHTMVFATTPYAIVIHGGAGTINQAQLSPSQQQAYEQK